MPILRIPGVADDSLPPSPLAGERVGKRVIITERKAIRIERTRAAAEQPVILSIANEDLIEVEFEGNVRLWTTWRNFQEDFQTAMPPRRGEGEADLFPTELALGDVSRGVGAWVIKAFRTFDVDLSGMTAQQIATWQEQQTAPHPGVFHCKGPGSAELEPIDVLPADGQPILLFLHGTLSSFDGSFGGLWGGPQSAIGAKLFHEYSGRVYAFEHQTLTKNPIENALMLVQQLPKNAQLHLVSHSRGGMIGELLCFANRPEPFDDKELSFFANQDEDEGNGVIDRSRDRAALLQLREGLKQKKPVVKRFVRVACPARGTTLASERLDRWLSLLINVTQLAGVAGQVADAALDLLAAVIKERTDPRTLPGLAAMMPTSPLVNLLNAPGLTVDADLTVISGDIEAAGIWGKLKLLAVDQFYDDDHDLVVNTSSMIGGVARFPGGRCFFDQGPQVNHFNYFKNKETAEKVYAGLSWQDAPPSVFDPIVKPTKPIARGLQPSRGAAGPRPVVFVLPGLMGSNLKLERRRVWVNYLALALGGLVDLNINARDVAPDGPIDDYYGDLIDYLSETHQVEQFAFDWRLSVRDTARKLADQISHTLDKVEQVGQPVRILAHSMGGLVVRMMIAEHPGVWERMGRNPGSRFLMLGTPNGGTFSIPRALFGQDKMVKTLALLDLDPSVKKLLKTISRFPNMLEMLPATGGKFDFFDPTVWAQFIRVEPKGWVQPEDNALRAAQETRALLARSPIDPQRMAYVAGIAPSTPYDLEIDTQADQGERLRFMATARGDGRVPWETGIPPGVPTWYMDCEHGDLAAHESAFPALLELLQTGQTALLSQTAPSVQRGVERFPLRRDIVDVYPSEEDIAAATIGSHKRRRRTPPQPRVAVYVTHGHLRFSPNVVAVGHYQGDTIVGPEDALDDLLGGRLRARLRLGLYPGPIGSSAVVLNPGKKPGGAIILGLGRVGELTPGQLVTGFTQGLLTYATSLLEQSQLIDYGKSSEPIRAAVSTLLIGTAVGGLAVELSIASILRGVARANRVLMDGGLGKQVLFTGIEFLELWEDRAIQATRALRRLTNDPLLRGQFAPEPRLRRTTGGGRRVVFAEGEDWHQRLQITVQEDDSLRFNLLTGRARSEVELQPTQRALVDQFIDRSIVNPGEGRQTAQTLFELLLPNSLKEQALNQNSLVLVLNEEAARYPWELLQDRCDTEAQPLAVKASLIRQLETAEFRARPLATTEQRALVVGDPVSQFVELPGAQHEADAVATLLTQKNFAVTPKVRTHSLEIVEALFAKDYRILHLAGHGVYQYEVEQDQTKKKSDAADPRDEKKSKKKKVSGMVIGTNVFLTPVEVEQMRQTPELVFINCCHLGKIEGDALDTDRTTRHAFAANLSAQFIRMGVRAVVAAGWAVDDKAAQTFAREFYTQLLGGQTFGEAVLQARKKAYEDHGSVNTWGAYQCYGDPSWKLIADNISADGTDKKTFDFVSPNEAWIAIDNIVNEAKTAHTTEAEELRKQLFNLAKSIPDEWLTQAELQAAFGRAYGELDLFAEAIASYKKALTMENGEASFKTVEQLANLQCQYAVELFRAATSGERREEKQADSPDPKDLITRSIALVDSLIQLSGAAEGTREQLMLLGSAYKRLAIVSTGEACGDALQKMARYYRAAHARAEKAGQPELYPLVNLIVSQYLLQKLFPNVLREADDLGNLLNTADSIIKAQSGEERDFWEVVAPTDYRLARSLVEDTLPSQASQIAQGYVDASLRAGSPREARSVLEHLGFLLDLWRADAQSEIGNARLAALAEIKNKLQSEKVDV